MLGAILGDMIGAPYEFDRSPKVKEFPFFSRGTQFTDDSVMTIAVADALINVTEISVGVVISACTDGCVNVSARSDGSINVQIIMEGLGGGGHQTVAGVQLQNADADEVKRQIIELTKKQFDEAEEKEKNESNLTE